MTKRTPIHVRFQNSLTLCGRLPSSNMRYVSVYGWQISTCKRCRKIAESAEFQNMGKFCLAKVSTPTNRG